MNDHDREVLADITDDIDLTELTEVTKDIRDLSKPIDWKAMLAEEAAYSALSQEPVDMEELFEGPQCPPDERPEIENYADIRGV